MTWIKCDFHIHTTRSDGKLPPKEVLKLYKKNGYDAIAITDHDTFTKPDYIPENLLWIPGEEYTADIRHPPLPPLPGVPKWIRFWFHVLMFYIDKDVKNDRDYKEQISKGALAFIAHPWTVTPDEFIEGVLRGLTFHGIEIVNGANKCFALHTGYAPRGIGGSDGHGHELAPYCSVISYVEADKNLDDIYEALLENKVVVKCGRSFYSTNKKISKKFEKEFNVKVNVLSPLAPHNLISMINGVTKYVSASMELHLNSLKQF